MAFLTSPQPTARTDPEAEAALRPVLVLMFVNLGLSVLTTVITLILHNSVLSYELAHSPAAAHATPAQSALERHALQSALWVKLGATVLVSAFYIWRAYALRRGSRGAYLRLYYICVAGLIGVAYLLFTSQYPVWMRVEQGLQAVVLAGLLIAVSRGPVRRRFSRRAQPS